MPMEREERIMHDVLMLAKLREACRISQAELARAWEVAHLKGQRIVTIVTIAMRRIY